MMLYFQYIYSLVLHTINNKHLLDTNNEIHKYKTRNNNNLFLISNFRRVLNIVCMTPGKYPKEYIQQ